MNRLQELKIMMLGMLKESKSEFKKYEDHKDEIALQQAGEKLFNVFERYLEIKYQTIKYRHDDIENLAMKDQNNFILFGQLEDLHEYFYHGSVRMTPDKAKYIYENVVGKIESKINGLR